MVDKLIGNYRVVRQLGQGGMARIYLAQHEDIPTLQVVLKVVSDPQLAQRFRREAEKLALLDGHAGVCRIRHFFNHGEDFVIAMEYIDGDTLEERIQKDGPFDAGEALRIINEVLDVIVFAHERKVYHRDIKSSNIMIDRDNRVRVIDFGIAKGEADPTMTAVHAYLGTPSYMAPEQFSSSEDIDYSLADIYAIGTTLFEMVCGVLPYTETDLFVLRDLKSFGKTPRPRKIRSEVPAPVEEIILTAMEKEPDNRYAAALEMQGAVQSCPQYDGPVTVSDVPQRKRRKSPLVWLIPAVVVVVAAVAAWFGFGPDEPRRSEAGAALEESVDSVLGPDSIVGDSARIPIDDAPERIAAPVPGTLMVQVDRPSRVLVNDSVVGEKTRRYVQALEPGEYRVEVVNESTREGRLDQTVQIQPGSRLERSFAFSDVPVGRVRLQTIPEEVTVAIDGGPATAYRSRRVLELKPGQRRLRVVAPSLQNREQVVQLRVRDGMDTTVMINFREREQRAELAIWSDSLNVLYGMAGPADSASAGFLTAERLAVRAEALAEVGDLGQAAAQYREAASVLTTSLQERRTNERAVMDVVESFRTAFEARDLASLERLYPSLPNDEREGWKTFFGAVKDLQVDLQATQITVLESTADVDLAVDMAFTDRDGPKRQQLRWTMELEKTDGRWRVTRRVNR